MGEIRNPENILEVIEADDLLKRSLELTKSGYRFSQACAAFVDGKFELSYSFSDYETYQLHNLRVVIDPATEIPSITEIVPAAVFYENEMKELFGVKIKMINLDYENKLYRIRQEAPMGPQKTEEEN
ncbi:MAG: NADH-quinone oxidoreductase subunit C [Lachnospiraceae bacterium]|nr:NADH-quinone oxidoreductase subunit C [Lachnospiraceae bacterium]